MKHIKGDLLAAFSKGEMDAFFQVCNSFNVWGGGIVIPIRKMFPSAYDADVEAYKLGEVKLGDYSYSHIDNCGTIYNLYAMKGIGSDGAPLSRNLSYDGFFDAIYKICQGGIKPTSSDPMVIGIPHGIGCCRAGGDWTLVLDILKRMEEMFNVEFVIYKLED